jgi:hypothetical protein
LATFLLPLGPIGLANGLAGELVAVLVRLQVEDIKVKEHGKAGTFALGLRVVR